MRDPAMVFQALFARTAALSPWGVACAAAVGWLIATALWPRASRHPLLGTKTASDTTVRLPRDLPTTLPVLGNLLDLIQHAASRPDWLTSHGERFRGEPVSVHIPGQPSVVVLYTPEAIEDVLKTQFDRFPKGAFQRDAFRDLLGHGVFAVDGAEWLHQRKTASHLFTARALRDSMARSIARCTVVLERVLRRAAATGQPVDVYRLLTRFTMDSFAEMGFGLEMNSLEAAEEHPFQRAFDTAGQVLVSRFQRPVWLWKLERWLNVGQERELKRCVEIVDRTVLDMVQKRLELHAQRADDSKAAHEDIISLFLSRVGGAGETGAAADAPPFDLLDPVFLRDLAVNFLLAGRDTTAQAMSWMLVNLSNRPDVAEKIRREIRTVLPDLASGAAATPSMEDVQRLTYLEAVVRETLRLHPSVPLIPKSPDEDTVLCDGTFIPAGATVLLPMYCMARLETVWGPDAKLFKPERWIDATTGRIRPVSPFKFFLFNAGPRTCLGMNLALLEIKLAMATLLSRFRVELLPEQTVTYANALTLALEGEVLARVTAL